MNWEDWLTFETIKSFFNSNFATALLGSLAGAFFGAWAAQKTAERTRLREELLREIRNINAASTLIYNITNSFLGLKKQHIKALRDRYADEKTRFQQFLAAQTNGTVPPNQVYTFNADLQTISPPNTPIEQIKAVLFGQTNTPNEILFVFNYLNSSLITLGDALRFRNKLLEDWHARPMPSQEFAATYFGTTDRNLVDSRYSDTIETIFNETDNVIGFSKAIGDELFEYATGRRTLLQKRFGGEELKLTKIQFPKAQDLMPPTKNIEDIISILKNGSTKEV